MAKKNRFKQVPETEQENQAIASFLNEGGDSSVPEPVSVEREVVPVLPLLPELPETDLEDELVDTIRKDTLRALYGTDEPSTYDRKILALRERAQDYV